MEGSIIIWAEVGRNHYRPFGHMGPKREYGMVLAQVAGHTDTVIILDAINYENS